MSGESETSDVADGTQGTVLRLEDLDAEFEKENQEAKEDVDNTSEVDEENVSSDTEADKESDDGESAQDEENVTSESTQEDASAASTEEPPSQEAFARNFAEYYQIEKGDTLCKISIKLYGDVSKVNEICEINKIDDPDNIKYGQKILLP